MSDNTSQARIITEVILSVKGPGDVDYVEIAEVAELPSIGGSSQSLDATTIKDKQKKYISGLPDPGDMTLKLNFATGSKQHQNLFDAQFKAPKDTYLFKAELPCGTVLEWPGEVGGMKIEGGQAGSILTATLTMSVKGEVKRKWPTIAP